MQTAHVIGWIVTTIAFGGNLLWNWLNRRHANGLAAGLRYEQYNLEVWSRFRSRIEDRLDTFVELVCNLPAQVAALPKDSDPDSYLNVMGLTLVTSQDALARVLAETDASPHCEGADWADAATGQQNGTETSWDVLLAQFEAARAVGDAGDLMAALNDLKPLALQIEHAVREKIRVQEWLNEPPKRPS